MRFGIDSRKNLTGAGLYMHLFQAVSLFPLVYIAIATGYIGITSTDNIVSYMFDFGLAAIPRYEALLISLAYRKSLSEIAVFFIIIGIALIFGLILSRLLKSSEKTAVVTRIVLIILIVSELILRLLPFGFNKSFGTVASVIGIVFRLICLVLIIIDLIKYKKAKAVTG